MNLLATYSQIFIWRHIASQSHSTCTPVVTQNNAHTQSHGTLTVC